MMTIDKTMNILRRARIAAAGIAMCLTASGTCMAIEFTQQDLFMVSEGESLAKEHWVSAGRVEISGTAGQDLFLLAAGNAADKENRTGEILLNGRCLRNVWAMARNVEASGRIDGSARLIARSVEISGSVGQTCMLIANTVHLTATGFCHGDILVVGENMVLAGGVGGDVSAVAASVTLSGEFKGNVSLVSDDITIMPGTIIAGDLIYRSGSELPLEPGVNVGGETRHEPFMRERDAGGRHSILMRVLMYAGALIAGMAAMKIFPARFAYASDRIRASALKSLLTGFTACALMTLIGFFAIITVVGAPLGALTLASAGILLYLGKIPVAIFVGSRLFQARTKQVRSAGMGAMAAGLLLVYFAAALPMVGPVVGLLSAFAGMGALISSIFASGSGHDPAQVIQTQTR